MQDPDRIVIIGAGHVGATAAYALMLRALFHEIILIDSDEALAVAEAADISDAGALARAAHIRAGSYADAASARIAVLTAGAATHGDESRLSVAARSADIVRSCVRDLMASGFGGIILVAANPVDLMAFVAMEASGLPAARVIGTGTLLDSNRLRQALARELGVAPAFIEAMILGEHGDTSFPALSLARVGGASLDRLSGPAGPIDVSEIGRTVRQAAYRIIEGKGYTSFGVATAIVRICEAIIRDEQAVLPVSSLLSGQFGIDGLYLSLPCIVGAEGISRVLEPDLNVAERRALEDSASALRQALKTMREAG